MFLPSVRSYFLPFLIDKPTVWVGFCHCSRAEGISGRVKFLLLAWAGMPKTSFRKNSDSPLYPVVRGRLVEINDMPVQQVVTKESQGERAIHRDLSLT
jgi:hypothetical protein